MKDENSWFTVTPTLEHRKPPAVFGPKDVTPVSRRAFGGARMPESTHEPSYLNSGTISLSALPQGKLYKNSLENSLSRTQQFMEQNKTLNKPRERIST